MHVGMCKNGLLILDGIRIRHIDLIVQLDTGQCGFGTMYQVVI